MKNFSNQNFIIASKSVTSAERNIVKPLLKIVYLQKQFDLKYSMTSRCLIVTRGKRTNYFYIFGGLNESSYESIQGITAAGAFLDEVVLMPQSFVNQALARCSVEGSKFWFTCNPSSPHHWFYLEWVKQAAERNTLYLHFTLDDNPSLSSKIKERYHNMYTGVFFDRYILGLWVLAEGIIYRKYADNEEDFLISEDSVEYQKIMKDLMIVNVGVDYGGTISAHTFVATGFTIGMKKVIALEAVRIEEELSPNELDAEFVKFCKMVYDKYNKSFNSRCDNAEPVLIRGFKNAAMKERLHTNVKNAMKKGIKSRIDLVIKLLGLKRLYFVKETTKPLQKGLREAVWSEKAPDTRLDDGKTSDIDILDAFEYSIEEYMNDLIDRELRV